MARLSTLGNEFNSVTAGVEWDTVSGAGATISTAVVRTGTYAAKCTTTTATRQGFINQFKTASNVGPFFVRFYLWIDTAATSDNVIAVMSSGSAISSAATVVAILTSSNTLKLQYVNGSSVFVDVGSPSSALSTANWYRVELKFDGTAGIAEGKIDGNVWATVSGVTFLGNVMAVRYGTNLTAGADTTGVVYFDDIAVNDSTGSFQTSYPGSGKVLRLKPSGAGDANTYGSTSGSQTGGTAGATNNFTRVNEVTPDDVTTFNGSTTLNEEDLLNVDDSGIGASDTVNVVEVWGRFRNDTADTAQTVKFEIEKTGSGTKTLSAAIIPNSTTWKTNALATPWTAPIVTYQDPDSSNWIQTTLDSIQIGYKLTVDGTGTRQIQVSNVSAIVDYTPVSATMPYSTKLNNYEFVKVGDGMSVTEKIK